MLFDIHWLRDVKKWLSCKGKEMTTHANLCLAWLYRRSQSGGAWLIHRWKPQELLIQVGKLREIDPDLWYRTPQFFNVMNFRVSGSSYIAEPCRAAECLVPPMRPKHTVLGTEAVGRWLQIVLVWSRMFKYFFISYWITGLTWLELSPNTFRLESMSSGPQCVFLSLGWLFIVCFKPLFV